MPDEDDKTAEDFRALLLAALEAMSNGTGADLGDETRPLDDERSRSATTARRCRPSAVACWTSEASASGSRNAPERTSRITVCALVVARERMATGPSLQPESFR